MVQARISKEIKNNYQLFGIIISFKIKLGIMVEFDHN